VWKKNHAAFSDIYRAFKMSIPQEVKLRQLLWSNYRAGKDKKEARININRKFGPNAISASMADLWYGCFQYGKICLLDKKVTHAIQTFSNKYEVGIF
jgi:hypothetical protein